MKITSRIALVCIAVMTGISSLVVAKDTKSPTQPTLTPKAPTTPVKPQEDKRNAPEKKPAAAPKTPVKPLVRGQFLPPQQPKNLVPTEAEAKKLEAENKKKLQQQLMQNNRVEKYAAVNYALKDRAGTTVPGQDGDLLMQAFPQKALNIGKQLASTIKRRLPRWLDNKAIFYGPKGTGKSALIKKLAKDNGCEYVRVLAPALVNEYQGSGSQNIKREVETAIALAQKTGKRVVMNIEEIDAIAKVGSSDRNSKTEESATQTLWLLLDDYKSDPRIFFACTTNHFDKLNPILKDRFRDSYLIEFKNPDQKLREDIMKMYMHIDEVNLQEVLKLKPIEIKRFMSLMAKRTNGMSTRALENMVHSFKMHIENSGDQKITKGDFIRILDESKLKSIEKKDSKEEWKSFDEWAYRGNQVGGIIGLFNNIGLIIKGVLGGNGGNNAGAPAAQ